MKSIDKKFNTKILIYFVLLIVFWIAFIYFISKAIIVNKNDIVKYTEKSNIDYKVQLKKNDFYDTDYLDKGMAYVAKLIDKINVSFNYNFNVNKKSDIEFSYKVLGKLIISSQTNSNIFYEKEYVLKDTVKNEINASNSFTIKEDIDIDYTFYNNIVNDFKSKYAVNTDNRLEVYLIVDENSKKTNSYLLANNNRSVLTIPLSQQEININLDNQNVDNEKTIASKTKFTVGNYEYVLISGVLLVFILILSIVLLRRLIIILNKNTSKYDRKVGRILRGYDRIIITVKTRPDMDDYNVIKVDDFQELIDARDNVKEPINYYVIEEHKKSLFYVIHNDNLYLFEIKSSDFDGE